MTKIMALTDPWLKNDERADIPGYPPVAQWKRDTVRAGGVCIYERLELSSVLTTAEHELVDLDTKTKEIIKAERAHTGVGDVCAVETTIGGRRALIMAVYLTPGTSMEKLELYFFKNLMGYSTRLIGLSKAYDKLGYGTMPLIVCGDFNVNLQTDEGSEFIAFMKRAFNLDLSNDPAFPTTRGGTCIDAVFMRHVDNVQTRNYISYFSYHKPLLSITDADRNEYLCNRYCILWLNK